MKQNRLKRSSRHRQTAVPNFNQSKSGVPSVGSTVRDTLQTWLCILFSVLWMGIGIAGLISLNNFDFGDNVPLAIGPLILLSLLMFVKGAYKCITSVSSLFRQ